MTVHIHVHRGRVTDEKFTIKVTAARRSGKQFTTTETVQAPDKYTAGDIAKANAEKKAGEELFYFVLQYQSGGLGLSKRSESYRVSKRAGPEES